MRNRCTVLFIKFIHYYSLRETFIKTVDNMTDRELQEMVFRMDVVPKDGGILLRRCIKPTRWRVRWCLESSGHVSTKLKGRVHIRVFWKEVVGYGLNGLLQKTIIWACASRSLLFSERMFFLIGANILLTSDILFSVGNTWLQYTHNLFVNHHHFCSKVLLILPVEEANVLALFYVCVCVCM